MIRPNNVLIVVGFVLAPVFANASEIILLEDVGIVYDVSANGQVVIGRRTPQIAWRWTQVSGLEELGLPGGEYENSVAAVASGDGSIIGGTVYRPSTIPPTATAEPWYWSVEGGWEPLELSDGTEWGTVFGGISADGSTIAGQLDGSAALWTNGELEQSFHEAFEDSISSGAHVTADGTVVVRATWNEGDPAELFIWTSQDGLTSVGGSGISGPRASSFDGSVLVGFTSSGSPSFDFQAWRWRWTEEESFVDIGLPGLSTFALDTNRDGSLVIGYSRSPSRETALVWDYSNEAHDLRRLLEDEHGLEGLPRRLSRARGISDDGRVIVGYNTNSEGSDTGEGWIVRLNRPIIVTTGVLGDFNGNAELDVEDLDLLALELQSDRDVALFDVDANDEVDFGDRQYWVAELANTFLGDANLDHEVNFGDFLALSSGFGGSGGWGQGDFDGDGETKFEDFLLLSENFGKAANMAASVPEPNAFLVLTMGMMAIQLRRSRRL